MPPATAIGPSSKFQVMPAISGTTNLADWYLAQAPRQAGILVGMGDGSVRLVSSSVTGDTWWYACTPDQGDIVGSDF